MKQQISAKQAARVAIRGPLRLLAGNEGEQRGDAP
jgi:hypothetical protein